MDAMRIAEVADRSGFPAPTLRYYEEIGLLPPAERTAGGYRVYDSSVLARLAFVARAKALGCSLEEIARLMPDWDRGRCAPVQDGLRALAAAKLEEAQARTAELVAFAGDLRRILGTLGTHTPDGPCDAACGCVSDPAPAVACTLDRAEMPGRLGEWHDLLAHATGRVDVDGGMRLAFDPSTPLADVARLVAAEQSCCAFFAFALTVDGRGLGLEVRAPAEGLAMMAGLFGP